MVFDGLIDPAVHDGQRAAGVDGDIARSNLLVVKVEDNVLAAIERCIAELVVARLLNNIDCRAVIGCIERRLKGLIEFAVYGRLICAGLVDFDNKSAVIFFYDGAGYDEACRVELKRAAVNKNLA